MNGVAPEEDPAIIELWENAWAESVPFLAFDTEIRTVICTTNSVESVNSRIRRAVNARGHFPSEQAALKCVYLAIMSLDPTGKARQRWMNRWAAPLNAFEIAEIAGIWYGAFGNTDGRTVAVREPGRPIETAIAAGKQLLGTGLAPTGCRARWNAPCR